MTQISRFIGEVVPVAQRVTGKQWDNYCAANLSSNSLLLRVKTAATRVPEGTAAAGVPYLVPLAGGNEAREASPS